MNTKHDTRRDRACLAFTTSITSSVALLLELTGGGQVQAQLKFVHRHGPTTNTCTIILFEAECKAAILVSASTPLLFSASTLSTPTTFSPWTLLFSASTPSHSSLPQLHSYLLQHCASLLQIHSYHVLYLVPWSRVKSTSFVQCFDRRRYFIHL